MELTAEELAAIDRQILEEVPLGLSEIEDSGWFCAERTRKRADMRASMRERAITKAIYKKQKEAMTKNIRGVNIEIDHPDLKSAKSISDLQKLGIFSNLGLIDQNTAYRELFAAINPNTKPLEDRPRRQEKTEESKSEDDN